MHNPAEQEPSRLKGALAPARSALWIGAAAFVLAFLLSLWLHHASALHDTDAYFHLAIARLYAENGVVEELPQLRLSLMRDGYGDKELLFHLALAPLSKVLPPLAAGRVALALLAGGLAALLAMPAARVLGGWGILFPFWLFFASTEWAWRLVRLRPELLALGLMLLAIRAMAGRRDVQVGVLAALFTWSYTAFHAFLGLIFLVFVAYGWKEEGSAVRRWPWRMLLYSWIGAGAALILHPHFPSNLAVWWVQNVVFFREKSELAVGSEIKPNTTDVFLMVHLGLFLVVLVTILAARRKAPEEEKPPAERELDGRLAIAFTIFASAFGILYLLMSRFSLYFWPFATLAVLFTLAARGYLIGAGFTWWGRRFPLALGLALGFLASLPEAWRQLSSYHEKTSLGPGEARIHDREQLAAALPPGARVAADWGPTATYLLWAPQASYLNALDPAFMAVPFPEEEKTLRRILEGGEPDVPGRTVENLASEFLAFPTVGHEKLAARLAADPRAILRHRGAHQLYQFRPSAELATNWRVVPEAVKVPIGPDQDAGAWPGAPGLLLPGFIAADPASSSPCATWVRDLEAAGPEERQVEWAATGRGQLWLNGRPLFEAAAGDGRLGAGLAFPLHLATGRNRLTVRLCAADPGSAKGFYWRERREAAGESR